MMHLYQTLVGHQGDVTCMDFNGSVLVTGSNDKMVRFFTLRQHKNDYLFCEDFAIQEHETSVTCVSFNNNGTLLSSGSYDGTVNIWRLSDEMEPMIAHSLHHGSPVRTLHFSPLGDQVCSGGDGKDIVIWGGVNTSIALQYKRLHFSDESSVNSIVYAPNGKFVIAGLSDGRITAWNSYKCEYDFINEVPNAHDLGVTSCDIKPNYYAPNITEYMLATGGHDDLVKIWKISDEKEYTIQLIRILAGHTNTVYCVKFRSDAKILVSTGNDHKINIWNPLSTTPLLSFEAHARAAVTCCYVDNSFLASGSIDRQVFIWKLKVPGFFTCDQIKPHFKPKELLKWNEEDVMKWITRVGFPQYADCFKANHVDGYVLMHATVDDLEKGLQITSFGHRMCIMSEIKFLKNPLMQHYDVSSFTSESWPNEFLCPITRELFKDPVVAEDGYTYERRAIENWFTNGSNRSPVTNGVMKPFFYPNRALLSVIKKYTD